MFFQDSGIEVLGSQTLPALKVTSVSLPAVAKCARRHVSLMIFAFLTTMLVR